MKFQKTIKKIAQFEGVGLHSGHNVKVQVRPAPANHGIVFVRADLKEKVKIPALSSHVVETRLSTTVGKGTATVSTIEHLMAALWGMGIDNAEVYVYGLEIPILDGSSYPFVKMFKRVGIKTLTAFRKILVVTEPVSVVDGDKYCYLSSYAYPKLTTSIEFSHPAILKQKYEVKIDSRNFYTKISKARTFGLLKDVERLRKAGLIAGGSLDNAIVLDDTGVMNPEGLRFKDEFVRHKALDAIGDLALSGITIMGHLVTHKAGHELHYKLIRKVMTENCGYILSPSLEDEQTELFNPISHAITA